MRSDSVIQSSDYIQRLKGDESDGGHPKCVHECGAQAILHLLLIP